MSIMLVSMKSTRIESITIGDTTIINLNYGTSESAKEEEEEPLKYVHSEA